MRDFREDFRAAILAALGYAPDEIEPGRFQHFAPRDRRRNPSGWYKLFDDLRGGVFGCHRQGISETWSVADKRQMTHGQRAALARQVIAATAEREAAQRRQWAVNAERIAELWAQCVPLVPGDPATLYLKRRGMGGVWPLPELLRRHRALPYWHEGEKLGMFPAMVAPIIAPDGRTVALHRTYLTADGRKADLPSPKKLTAAAGPLSGACIPLHKPARGLIGIAEGIETALAAWCASAVPTLAAYCAGNLAAWQWPTGVRRLLIFADADEAGAEAARKLRRRAIVAGLSVRVATPSEAGTDFCDAWARRGVASREGAEV
jgi:phage/plasmid primase-like uncharacterized protein